jgi:hypothetical protein
VRGPLAGWYPYPFLKSGAAGGYGGVAVYCLAIFVGALVLTALPVWVGRLRADAIAAW